MRYGMLICVMLAPAMLIGQSSQLSKAARKLLTNPQLGEVELTWSDGRKERGRIAQVNNQFVAFVAGSEARIFQTSACENVELSKVADVRWRHVPGDDSASRLGNEIFLGALFAPFLIGDAVADPFRRMSPPLEPLRGTWESTGRSFGGRKSTLVFEGSKVSRADLNAKRGRYHAERGRLHMTYDDGSGMVTAFGFKCGKLFLDNPSDEFSLSTIPHHVAAPIVGEWRGSRSNLNLKSDGSFEERKWETTDGTFEKTAARVTIHWAASQGSGIGEWFGAVKNHHLVFRVGATTVEYGYAPPGFYVDDM